MKIVSIYFDNPEKIGYPFDNPKYYETYRLLNKHCTENGIELRFSRGKDTYRGSMQFSSYWQFTDDDMTFIDKSYIADLIYIKGLDIETSDQDVVINQKRLQDICRNKLLTYEVFPEYVIPTHQISNVNADEVLDDLETQTVVIKPVDGVEGRDVQIINKDTLDSTQLVSNEITYIAQPFIDSSSGVPGLTNTYHDLRLFVFNGEIKKSYIRVPQEGSLMANIALGAEAILLPPIDVPDSARELVRYVEKVFHAFTPRIYTLDIMYEEGKPYIVELNDQPGIPYADFGEYTVEYYHHLIDVFNSV